MIVIMRPRLIEGKPKKQRSKILNKKCLATKQIKKQIKKNQQKKQFEPTQDWDNLVLTFKTRDLDHETKTNLVKEKNNA